MSAEGIVSDPRSEPPNQRWISRMTPADIIALGQSRYSEPRLEKTRMVPEAACYSIRPEPGVHLGW